jgi:pyruvyltransferase
MQTANQIARRKGYVEQKPVHAFWCRIPSLPNFGDALTPWLITRLTGLYPVFVRPEDPRPKYFVVGSIIGYAGAGCTVWGAGIIHSNDLISRKARLLAVRGPLTRARALECGARCPEIYGDPALLLPRFYRPRVKERRGIGFVAHFSDKPHLAPYWRLEEDLRLIDIQDPIESVIDQIAACEVIASSSLHGIIVSHAYGIPAVWVKFRDSSRTNDTKFHDYFLSIGQKPPAPVVLDYSGVDGGKLLRRVPSPTVRLDLGALWDSCPFRTAT